MRQVVVFNRITLDGLFAGPHGEIDWFIGDGGLDRAVHGVGKSDTLLMGRVTYQMFESFWPKVGADPKAPPELKATAQELDLMQKVVFSRTLGEVTWENARLAKAGPVEEVRRLKDGTGLGMLIFGSGTIVQLLTAQGLIDEYLLAVTPVILGAGKPLFAGHAGAELRLVEARSFETGNVLLRYRWKGIEGRD